MAISVLPGEWEATRATLQRYAHAVTALPRAGAPEQPRWAHVAMVIEPRGLVAAATPMADGSELVSLIDLVANQIVVAAGETRQVIDMTGGPSPKSVGEAIAAVAASHGSALDVDAERYSDESTQAYDAGHAGAFLSTALSVVAALEEINESVDGEISGPHLWPHGFDIATEWYSPNLVDYEGTPTSAQIAVGWYPAGDAYFYANPWPFDDSFLEADLPDGATWNTEGWFGAKLNASDVDAESGVETVVALGRAVHDAARDTLTT